MKSFGVHCEKCKSRSTLVIDSRELVCGHRRRRRKCLECKNLWTTFEISKAELDRYLKNDKLIQQLK